MRFFVYEPNKRIAHAIICESNAAQARLSDQHLAKQIVIIKANINET